MTSVSDMWAAAKAAFVIDAERAREYAEIHNAACRYRAQGLVCSTCTELDERAARLAKLAGGAS